MNCRLRTVLGAVPDIDVGIAMGFPVHGVALDMKVPGGMNTAHLGKVRPVPGGKDQPLIT